MTKRIVSVIMTLVIVLGITGTAVAVETNYQKEETVYVVLDHNGDVDNIYAVNSFEMDQPGQIIDFGDYSSVRNMTTKDIIDYADGSVTINAPAGKFYYQGNTVFKEMPWDINIYYTLDDERIDANALIGQSGSLEITIEVKKNDKIRQEFFENYSLQISMSLDTEKCSNIEADGATMANAGKNKSITFTHLPNTEKIYTIRADANEFEMAPISFNGISLSMDIDLAGVEDMTKDLSKLSDGIGKLNNGAKELKKGSNQFSVGINGFASSIKDLDSASNQINSAITQSAGGLSTLLENSNQLETLANALLASTDPQVQALANGYLAQVAALQQLSAGLGVLSGQYSQFDMGIGQLSDGMDQVAESYIKIDDGIAELSSGINDMNRKTATMDTDIEDKIDEMLAQFTHSDYKPGSFISEKNTNVKAVQFVIRTDALELPEQKQPAETNDLELTFWQKLLKLFGLYEE